MLQAIKHGLEAAPRANLTCHKTGFYSIIKLKSHAI